MLVVIKADAEAVYGHCKRSLARVKTDKRLGHDIAQADTSSLDNQASPSLGILAAAGLQGWQVVHVQQYQSSKGHLVGVAP